ncbi:MAG: ATP-binding protein [Pseudomonadota bacterium]
MTLGILMVGVHLTHRAHDRRAEALGGETADRIRLALSSVERQVIAFSAHLSTVDRIDPVVFHRFFTVSERSPDKTSPGAFAFMPVVPRRNVVRLDRQMQMHRERYDAAGYPAFKRVDQPAPFHFPVILVEPPEARTTLFGFDYIVAEMRLETARRAIETGEPALSPPIVLGNPATTAPFSLLLMAPVSLTPQAVEDLGAGTEQGVVSASIQPEPLLRAVAERAKVQPSAIRLVLMGAEKNSLLLVGPDLQPGTTLPSPSAFNPFEDVHIARPEPVPFGDQTIRVELAYVMRSVSAEALSVLAFSLLSLTATGFLAISVRRRELQAALIERELQRKEAALRRAAAAGDQTRRMESLGRLVGGVAHDFNNLLTVILGNLEFLRDERLSVERDGFVDAAVRATERGRALTRQLLAFGRRARLDPEPGDMSQLVAETQTMLRRVVPASVTIHSIYAETLWPVLIDRDQLENALLNLTLNARDAMPNGGTLTIQTANRHIVAAEQVADLSPGRYVTVSVSDTGTGMDDATAQQAFEPFYTTKPAGEGSGLGLSMVFGFAKQSGGSAEIESTPGAGTTVRLYFPVAQGMSLVRAPAAAAPAAAPAEEPAGSTPTLTPGSGQSILLVEDDEGVRRILAARLRGQSYRVTVVENGDRALGLVENGHLPDLLITDVVMTGSLQGPALADRVMALHPPTRVVFLSGYPRETVAEADEQANAHAHGIVATATGIAATAPMLQKPVSARELLATVADALADRP